MQLLPHNFQMTYITPNAAGLITAGWGSKKNYENRFPQIPSLGGDMKSRFSTTLKETLVCVYVYVCVCVCLCLCVCLCVCVCVCVCV